MTDDLCSFVLLPTLRVLCILEICDFLLSNKSGAFVLRTIPSLLLSLLFFLTALSISFLSCTLDSITAWDCVWNFGLVHFYLHTISWLRIYADTMCIFLTWRAMYSIRRRQKGKD